MARLFIFFFFLFSVTIATADTAREDYMKLYTVDGRYADVRDDLQLAITGRGIKINTISHIGDMLHRTGKDLGATKEDFAHAEAFEFCSATVSRKTMEADPHNIVFCPYVIAVYSLPNESNKTYIAFRRPLLVGTEQSKAALRAVEKLMSDIVAEVAQ